MIGEYSKKILAEIAAVMNTIDDQEVECLVSSILKANRIVVHGAGRVGMACRGLAMRLGHLGLTASSLGDSAVPAIGVSDLVILGSGSGETQTTYDIGVLAKRNRAHLAVITGRSDSRIGKMADSLVIIRAPSKAHAIAGLSSIQPMTTLNEQCLQIFFDALVLVLMEKTGQTNEDLWARHSNLE